VNWEKTYDLWVSAFFGHRGKIVELIHVAQMSNWML
jgi:hypothetical protein